MAEGEVRRSTVVRCEKHGLHYDPAVASGCVRCRREARGEPPAPAGRAAAPAARGSLGPALLVTFVLLAAATLGLVALHDAVLGLVRPYVAGAAGEAGETGGTGGMDPAHP